MVALFNKFFQPRFLYGLTVSLCLLNILYFKNFIYSQVIGGFIGNYLLPSIVWILLALVVSFLLPRGRDKLKRRDRHIFKWAAFLSAFGLVFASYGAGLLGGLGTSPYDHSFKGILINLICLGSMLVGIELCRAWLINYTFKKHATLGIISTGTFFSLFLININRIASIENIRDGAEFAGNIFFPTFAESIFASYIVFLGGAIPAIIYRGTLMAFHWFMPVLPDLSWVAWALIGTFVPAFSMVIIHQLYRTEVLRIRSRKKESPAGWMVTSVVSVLMIWFAVGVFNVFPNVIISGSMLPEIDIGDIVIVKRVEPEQVEVGDVIQFREIEEDIRINHRVIKIKEDERGLPLFITKGDANRNPDSDPVLAEQLMGKVVQVVPKIGWVTIMLRSPG